MTGQNKLKIISIEWEQEARWLCVWRQIGYMFDQISSSSSSRSSSSNSSTSKNNSSNSSSISSSTSSSNSSSDSSRAGPSGRAV